VLFNRAAIINDTFQDQMQSIVESLNATKRRGGQIGVSTGVCVGLGSPLPQRSDGAEKEEEGEGIVLRRGPVKLPERAMQKCVRSYRRDAGCLADLVRCTLIAKTPQLVMFVRDGSLICVTWLVHTCHISHSCMWHETLQLVHALYLCLFHSNSHIFKADRARIIKLFQGCPSLTRVCTLFFLCEFFSPLPISFFFPSFPTIGWQWLVLTVNLENYTRCHVHTMSCTHKGIYTQ